MLVIEPKKDQDILTALKMNKFVAVNYKNKKDKKNVVTILYTIGWNANVYSYSCPGPSWVHGLKKPLDFYQEIR